MATTTTPIRPTCPDCKAQVAIPYETPDLVIVFHCARCAYEWTPTPEATDADA